MLSLTLQPQTLDWQVVQRQDILLQEGLLEKSTNAAWIRTSSPGYWMAGETAGKMHYETSNNVT